MAAPYGHDQSPFGGGGMDWKSLPTKPRENLPVSVPYKGRDVMIYTFQQIDRIGKKALKERAMNMRDLVGADNLPRFSPGLPDEAMVAWLLEAQTIVAAACGVSLTVTDLGAPTGGDGVGAYLSHLANAQPPQYSSPLSHHHSQQQQQQQQQQQLQQPDVYVVERLLDVRIAPNGMASHFLVKWAGRGMDEASWEVAADMQMAAPRAVADFKQQMMRGGQQPQQYQPQQYQQQQQQQYHQQQQYQQQQQQQYHHQQQQQQFQQQYQPTDLRGNPIRSRQQFSPQAGSPMRPDQEADNAREAARKRNMGSNIFG